MPEYKIEQITRRGSFYGKGYATALCSAINELEQQINYLINNEGWKIFSSHNICTCGSDTHGEIIITVSQTLTKD